MTQYSQPVAGCNGAHAAFVPHETRQRRHCGHESPVMRYAPGLDANRPWSELGDGGTLSFRVDLRNPTDLAWLRAHHQSHNNRRGELLDDRLCCPSRDSRPLGATVTTSTSTRGHAPRRWSRQGPDNPSPAHSCLSFLRSHLRCLVCGEQIAFLHFLQS
jgi:hypothetical protein